ncbi:MAG: hypothetical protein JSS53_04295 [Proteobacteria bacterium]|nr:hypothetical protein [Pseudomonadota bacterium]
MKRVLGIAILFIILPIFIFAKTGHHKPIAEKNIQTTLYLDSIDAIKVSEKNGDDLYINITAYPSQGKNYDYNIPTPPMYWMSKETPRIKKLKLWEGTLKPGQSIMILLSLIDQDFEPWNTDDLIGDISIRLKNQNGELLSDWHWPNREDAIPVINTKNGPARKVLLTNGHSSYNTIFMLHEHLTQDTSDDITQGAKKYQYSATRPHSSTVYP